MYKFWHDKPFTKLKSLICRGVTNSIPKSSLSKFVPLSPFQLFLVAHALSHPVLPLDRLGSQEDITALGIKTAFLIGCQGFRFGELFPSSCLAINRRYSAYEEKGILKVNDLVIYFPHEPPVFLFKQNLALQLHSLHRARREGVYSAVRAKRTKPGRARFGIVAHHHLFNSDILCPFCSLLKILIIQIRLTAKPLQATSYLITFPYKSTIRPITVKMVVSALDHFASINAWAKIRIHDAKRGSICCLALDADYRNSIFLPQLGDHAVNYDLKYRMVPLEALDEALWKSRVKHIISSARNTWDHQT